MNITRGLTVTLLAMLAGLMLVGCQTKEGQRAGAGLDSFRLRDASLEARISVSELVASKAAATISAELGRLNILPAQKAPETMIADFLGINASDIEHVVISAAQAPKRWKVLIAIASRRPIDQARAIAALGRTGGGKLEKIGSHAGIDLWAQKDLPQEGVAAFVGPNLMVLGDPQEVKRGIDDRNAGRSVPLASGLHTAAKALPADAAIGLAAIPTKELLDAIPLEGDSPLTEPVRRLDCLALAVRASDVLDVSVYAFAKAERDAAELRRLVSEYLEQAKGMVAQLATIPAMKPLKDVLDGVKVAGGGRVAEFHGVLHPDSITAALGLVRKPR